MHNAHGRKPLYEAIREAQAKSAQDKSLQPLHPEPVVPVAPKPAPVPESVMETPKPIAPWPSKPPIFQFMSGRIEFSLPYQLIIGLVLCAIVVTLIVFRLGQNFPIKKGAKQSQPAFEKPRQTTTKKPVIIIESKTTSRPANSVVITESATPGTPSKGNNRIVIQAHQSSKDLEAVQNFFAQNGVKTEIRKIGSWYYLITSAKYDNPDKSGTDGYAAKQQIIELGAKYQPPPGYGSFGAKPFSDAYGMRFDD